MADSRPPVTPVILCGGAGTRLWPASRRARPKHRLAIGAETSLLRQTAERVGDRSLFAPSLVVTAASEADEVEKHVAEPGLVILEPCPRNTAAAIALAALNAPEATLVVLPSDHLVADAGAFAAAVRRGLPLAEQGWIVTFGMTPDRAETGYGYIERGEPIGDGVWAARRFVEKPDAATAQAFVASGGFDWNAGIFLARAEALIAGLDAHAPEILAAARAAVRDQRQDGRRVMPDAAAFAAAPPVSIDHAVMEHADRVAVVPAAIGWSDVGSWAAVHAAAEQDAAGNALSGNVLALDSSGSLIRSDGPLVVAIGVTDLVVVATADAILVVPREQSQRVREAVERLGEQGDRQLL